LTFNNEANSAIIVSMANLNSLSFAGAAPTIQMDGPGGAVLAVSGSAFDVGNATLIQGAGTGVLTIEARMSGAAV
jgi:hypothetical protein